MYKDDIKELMKTVGVTNAEFSAMCGVTLGDVTAWLSGNGRPGHWLGDLLHFASIGAMDLKAVARARSALSRDEPVTALVALVAASVDKKR